MKLKIPIYGWNLVLYRMYIKGKTHKIPDNLMDELSDEMTEDLTEALNSGGLFGRCYWNEFNRIIRVVLCTDSFEDGDYVNRFAHEINHLIDEIMKHSHIDDTEARSFLTGWLYQNFREKGFI